MTTEARDIVERLRNMNLDPDLAAYARHQAANEIDRLRAENARLREALKPFADETAYWVKVADDCFLETLQITAGDLRNAARALSQRQEGGE